ncbi:MAG: [citrate (pro-3S)-lyase] ligase [Muribaculaceae bacterium]|nr:[citrate (pro-3S)-lyase] ligase [Muribaculaceae bacterium]
MYSEYEIRTLPLSLKATRNQVERFLASYNLRLDDVDTYAVVSRIDDDTILAGGGLKGNVIKCVAVSDEQRGTGLMQRLLSHLLSEAHASGHDNVKVFTKPDNQDIFESLGFKLLASAPQAIFMEHGMAGINVYCDYLRQQRLQAVRQESNATCGAIVMNANPFTLGHQALVEWASTQVDFLFVIAVREDCSTFSYRERLHMIQAACEPLNNVMVCEGSDYAISAATFPTYFLKRLDDATDTQITLDLDLFAQHIAPALGVNVRFVGSEPIDELTARYVELMRQQLPAHGIEVRVMDRVTDGVGPMSASRVRKHLEEGLLQPAAQLVPATTAPLLIAHLAGRALQMELDTTPKPGLVDRNDNGAHTDMDYGTMQQSINALMPYFDRLAEAGFNAELPSSASVKALGLQGEEMMLNATQGVNTHKGAIFALGQFCIAAAHALHEHGGITALSLQADIKALSQPLCSPEHTHGSEAVGKHHVKGALAMAQNGYQQLFGEWLPFYRSLDGDTWQLHKTLLHIMASLDDTNIIYRVGFDRAQQVKAEAQALLHQFSPEKLEDMNRQFIADNISPGGAADMLSLTIYADALIFQNTNDSTSY